MTVLTTPRVTARAPAAAAAIFEPATVSPVVIETPRGGVFENRARRAGGMPDAELRARDAVLGAIWPLLAPSTGPAPGPAAATICDAAVARIRSTITSAIAALRGRIGAVARSFDGAERVMVEDLALTLKVDEALLLDRMVTTLSPQELVGAAVPGRTPVSDAIERAVGSRVELHMLGLIRDGHRLGETTKALVLFALSDANA